MNIIASWGMPNFLRSHLPHDIPAWVPDDSSFFLTVSCSERGRNSIGNEKTANILLESVAFRQGMGHWNVKILLLMPDHLHMIATFNLSRFPVKKVIRDWKRFLSRMHQIRWQDDFFDHRIRNSESFREKYSYIRENPVRANLCESAEEWPYCWNQQEIESLALNFGER